MPTELPADILFSHILPRLPAKSVSRFKCVSKQWQSFLSASDFSKIHLRHVTTDDHQNHHKFLFFSSSTKPTATFHTLDCESPDHDGLTAGRRSLPFKVGRSGKMTFITSFNGLVCLGITNNWYGFVYSNMILWNPCTGDYKTLSKPINSHKECYEVTVVASGLYYSDSDDDYRLLRVTMHLNAYIYSLKSNSWRKLDSMEELETIGILTSKTWGASVTHNEKLYFLKKGKRRTIIRFDTKTEKFRKLTPFPFCGDHDATICLNAVLLHKDRKIHLCEIHSCGKGNSKELMSAKLWRMDGDGEWRKVVSYPIPINFNGLDFEPLHLMNNGNWATLCPYKCHVYKLDPARDFRKISAHIIDNPPKGKYIETLVSPNR